MATVKVIQKRQKDADFSFYRTSVGGDESIIVRRKVGDPTDYMHTKSRTLQRQRVNFTLASQHYARLTPSQKAITRHQFEWVEYQQSHGKTDTKLLMGRQLFIAKEIRSLNVTQKPLVLPYELCIMLVDEVLNPLEGELWLRYLQDGQWLDCSKEELSPGNWLFSQVPVAKEAYLVYGEAEGYFDPQLPQHQYMSEEYLLAYHYHCLMKGEVLYSYTVKGVFVRASYPFLVPWDAQTCRISIQIATEAYDGIMYVGLKEHPNSHVPDEWIAVEGYQINPSLPDPKYFYTILHDCHLEQGKWYWQTLQMPTNQTNYFDAQVYFNIL